MISYSWNSQNTYTDLKPLIKSHAICFNNHGQILLIKTPNSEWFLPGGKIKKNETPEQALVRELEEEADAEISHYQMIGYIRVEQPNHTEYEIKYACILDKINEPTIDPAYGEINERILIPPNEFFTYIKIEDYREFFEQSLNWFKNQ